MNVEDKLNMLREQVKHIPVLLESINDLQKQVKDLQDPRDAQRDVTGS